MQKASPGQLLFGEATNRLLPSSLKVKEAEAAAVDGERCVEKVRNSR